MSVSGPGSGNLTLTLCLKHDSPLPSVTCCLVWKLELLLINPVITGSTRLLLHCLQLYCCLLFQGIA